MKTDIKYKEKDAKHTKSTRWLLVSGLPLALLTVQTFAAPIYRPEQTRRTINTDQYELVVQKNSQIDLLTLSGEPIVDNAFPSVILEGGEIKSLAIDYRNSNRFSVKNPLGQGNGFHFVSPECEWRVSTYPTAPFITVDLTFINHTSTPVTLLGLSPFGIGNADKGGVYLGQDGAKTLVLQNASPGNPFSEIAAETKESLGHLAAYNPASGRTVVAGFLTRKKGRGQVTLLRTSDQTNVYFDRFDAVFMFNDPVFVGPGERVDAESLYLAIVEFNPQEALERFAAASAAMEKSLEATAPAEAPTADVLPRQPATLLEWGLASRQYYLPAAQRTDVMPWGGNLAEATRDFDDNQFITALTLAAMQGGVARAAESASGLSPLHQHILDRLQPPRTWRGRPIDLFQEGPPRQWYMRAPSKAGEWTIAALFNVDPAAPLELDTPLTAIGLNDDNRYTVYDYWAGRYLGLIEKTLRVEVPPEGVRLLGLRRYENRPMLVACNQYFTQGASDHTGVNWEHAAQTLTGTLDAIAGDEYTLTILIPEPYVLNTLTSTGDTVTQSQTEAVLTFTLRARTTGPLQWTVTF